MLVVVDSDPIGRTAGFCRCYEMTTAAACVGQAAIGRWLDNWPRGAAAGWAQDGVAACAVAK